MIPSGPFWELLMAVLMIVGLVGSLCLLILFVRTVLCRWPDVLLRLGEDETRTVSGGQSLLAAVRGEGFLLPGSCGGRGTCGICRMRVTRGGGAPSPSEELLVSPTDLRSDIRLACQVRVRGEIEAELPEDVRSARFVRSVVVFRETISLDIYRLVVRPEEPPDWRFAAGQYVQVYRERPRPGDEPLTRAYSLASDPAEPETLELHIRRIPEGELSPWLCDRKIGDELWFSGPYGTMILPETEPGTEIVCVAGGVGFAPMKSIVLEMTGRPSPSKTWLFAGAATPEALYEHAWTVAMAQKFPWLVYVPCVQDLSSVSCEDADGFEQGLITEAIERRFPSGTNAIALLCGPERMIAASRRVLAAKGIPPSALLADVFS